MTANLGAVAVDTPRRLQKSGRGVAAVELGFMVADIAVADIAVVFAKFPEIAAR
jgi:Flp pilus assembly pilin Flp